MPFGGHDATCGRCHQATRVPGDVVRIIRTYGDDPSYHAEPDTDFAAIADGLIAVTPLHFDLTSTEGIEQLGGFDLDGLIRPAATEVE